MTVLDNGNLDDWWVSHVKNNQLTDLSVDMTVIVGADVPGSPRIPVDSDELDYPNAIETDIFGTKNETSGTNADWPPGDSTPGDGSGDDTADGSDLTPTPTDSPTPADDGGLLAM
jgi:hypothetical protein